MLIQVILQHEPQFYRKVMRVYYDRIESDLDHRPSREGLLNYGLRKYRRSTGSIRGRTWKHFPSLMEPNSSKVIIRDLSVRILPMEPRKRFSDPMPWMVLVVVFMEFKRGDCSFRPSFLLKHNLSSDGYHYADSNGQPYEVTVRNVFGKKYLITRGFWTPVTKTKTRRFPTICSPIESVN